MHVPTWWQRIQLYACRHTAIIGGMVCSQATYLAKLYNHCAHVNSMVVDIHVC